MPELSKDHVALYTILLDGGEIPREQRDRIKEIRVVDHLRLPDVCTITITYPKADGIDSHPFTIGKKLEVRLGAVDEQSTETLFEGEILTLLPTFGKGGVGLTIRAYDRAHRMNRARKVRTFQNQTSTDIVKKIAGEYGLTFEGDASDFVHDFMQQDNETDWDLALRLAERCGFIFRVRGTKAYFGKKGIGETVELKWPDTLRSFEPRVTAVQQVSSVSVYAQDPMTKQAIEAQVSSPEQIAQIGVDRNEVKKPFADADMHVATEPVKTMSEATTLAQALLDKLANGYIAAEGMGPGNTGIRAGATVKVTGVGSRFSGTYRVATSRHVLRSGGYETQFANSPSHTILGAVGADGHAPARFGADLVIGIVTNVNDPEKMGRVRVQYPALGDDAESAWARIAAMSAGNARGALMLPVVGEEVLVGFEHGDTTRPYVLGSLFNGRDLPGPELLEDTDGSFAVRSDQKIYTESQKQYTIKSNDKLVIEVSGAVEETIGGDWINKTTGKASAKANQTFEIEGGQSVSIKGMTGVTIESSATVTLKVGGSSVEVSQMGVRISGPMINIG